MAILYYNIVMHLSRKPRWIKAKLPGGPNYNLLRSLTKDLELNTVCQEAKCPNIGECWNSGTLTFMILGDTCTRSCGFCHVTTGRGAEIDWQEPLRVAQAVNTLKNNNAHLKHIVITSVNRDDKNLESAELFAETIKRVRELNPEVKIEVLIPDFKGDRNALLRVLEAKPDVLNHNIETVPRLYTELQPTSSGKQRAVRPQARYEWSLEVLRNSRADGHREILTKTGLMVGVGEELEEVVDTLRDLKNIECDIVSIGQYLQPTKHHIEVSKFYHPLEFESLKSYGEKIIGIPHIEAGPLVRSSYHADKQVSGIESNHL